MPKEGPAQRDAVQDFEAVTEVSTTTHYDDEDDENRAERKRSLEGTDNSASSATDAERDGQEGLCVNDGETL